MALLDPNQYAYADQASSTQSSGEDPSTPGGPGGPEPGGPVSGIPAGEPGSIPGGTGGTGQWDPFGNGPDPMDFNTIPGDPGQVPEYPYYLGDAGPNLTTQWQEGNGNTFTQINPDGSITPGVVDPTTRNVQKEELVEERLSNLLRSDSKYMQDARRQGMEQSNALGGLGGTVGAGASMQAALRAGLPIAQSDAEAYRAAAAQNMDALNQFAQLNHQRTTALEQTQIDARTRLQTTQIQTSAQMAAAQLESATQRDLGRLSAETQLRVTEMDGQIRSRLADQQHEYTVLLNDMEYAFELARTNMQGNFGLADTQLKGEWDMAIREKMAKIDQTNLYIEASTNAYTGALNRIADLNGTDMDQNARNRATEAIMQGYYSQQDLINSLFPDVNHFSFGAPAGSSSGS